MDILEPIIEENMKRISPIKDPLSRVHNRNNLPTKNMLQGPKFSFSHIVNTFEEQTTFLQRDRMIGPNMSFVQRFH